MKNILYLVGAFILVAILWHIFAPMISFVLHLAFSLALLGLFAGAVMMVYKALSREKLKL